MNLSPHNSHGVEVGLEPVTVVKLFGPTIFCDVQVQAVLNNEGVYWSIRRQRIDDDGVSSFEEVFRIDAQESLNLKDGD